MHPFEQQPLTREGSIQARGLGKRWRDNASFCLQLLINVAQILVTWEASFRERCLYSNAV